MTAVLLLACGALAVALVFVRRRGDEAEAEVRRLESVSQDMETLMATRARQFADLGHELRTPLTLMLGPLELTHDQSLTGLAGNTRRMLRVVEQLIDAASIDADQVPFTPTNTDCAAVVRELMGSAAPYAAQRGVRLEEEGLDELPSVLLDSRHFETIVANLLSNAVKFTPRGALVLVRASFSQEKGLLLEVQDQGPGIPVEVQATLFDRTRRGHVLREQEGSGLGLAIARQFARLHGGSLTLHSVLGRGSSFLLRIPASLPVSAVVQTGAPPVVTEGSVAALRRESLLADLHGAPGDTRAPEDAPRVLVVDDNADLREFLAWRLGRTYVVQTAGDGDEALTAARLHQPDLILADVLMPRVDGHALLRSVRSDPLLHKVPVLLLSGRSEVSHIVEGLEAGADGYLTKPFHLAELEAWVASMLRGRAAEHRLEERDSRLAAVGMMASGLAHDLANPLAIVRNYSELAREAAAEEGQTQLVSDMDTIMGETERIQRLLNELKEFAAGADAEVVLEERLLSQFVSVVVEPMRTTLGGLQLLIEDRSEGAILPLHEDSLRRALENLLSNARDAGAGRIRVVAEPKGVLVSDDGPGIDQGRLAHLFQPWVTEGKEGGTGLGLAIVQNTLRSHGGRVDVLGRGPDGGAQFRLVLRD